MRARCVEAGKIVRSWKREAMKIPTCLINEGKNCDEKFRSGEVEKFSSLEVE